MPFVSQAQQKYLNANPDKLGPAKLAEFNAESAGLQLPKRAPKKVKKVGMATKTVAPTAPFAALSGAKMKKKKTAPKGLSALYGAQ